MMDYFSEEVYSPDPNDSSQAIPYAVTKSIIFIFLGSIFVMAGYIILIMGQCLDQKSCYTLISGLIFIQTGLVMLCGLVMYIAIFKSEVGSKLRPKSHLQPAAFEYYYGYSFIVYITSIVFTKASGVSCIFLYIYRARYEWRMMQLDYIKRDIIAKQGTSFPHPRDALVAYPCKRHPEAYINTNSAIRCPRSAELHKHNYFARNQNHIVPCSVHQRIYQTNSLKDMSVFYNIPRSSSLVSHVHAHHMSMDDLKILNGFPRDLTTNTVSTTVDMAFDNNYYTNDDFSTVAHNEPDVVTFDFDQSNGTGFNFKSEGGFEIGHLRRTTPV